jgi:hypothetical protein
VKSTRQLFFQKITGLFLLAVISFFITPKELIHELHHDDTIDAVCMDACKDHISAVHQHCDVLQLTTPPLYHQLLVFSFNFESFPFTFLIKSGTTYFTDCVFSFYLRGPPSVA